jgi:microcystin-dependent protein
MSFKWGQVASVSPLKVRLDGSSTAVPVVRSLVGALTVGDMVRCELAEGKVVLYGLPGGDSLPAGTVSMTAATAVPSAWLLCDGQQVSRATYSGLFAAIGTTYGAGNGSTTFNVPNLKGRVPVGRDAGQTEFDTLGDTGGAKTHTLTTTQIPEHAHRIQRTNIAASAQGIDSSTVYKLKVDSGADFSTTQNAGGGEAHNNLQPYIALNYIIKT